MNEYRHTTDLEHLFTEAVAAHQSGNQREAEDTYKKILSFIPDSPLVNFNYGLLLFELGKFEQSSTFYRKALKQSGDNPDVLYNLALCLQKAGNFSEPVELYEKILQSQPDDVDTLYNLACLHKDQGIFGKAIRYYRTVLKIDSKHRSSLNNVAFLYHQEEQYELARKYYRELLNVAPGHPSATYMLQSLGESTPDAAPPEYVKEVFDAYAASYDTKLTETLLYKVPLELRHHYNRVFPPGKGKKTALDLGCGTGLAGETFFDVCERLEGVDISDKMISAALLKNIYTGLHSSELLEFLTAAEKKYNLFLAADVFTYIGDLNEIFKKLYELALPASHFCFSTELDESHLQRFVLRKSGRYAHSIKYIEELCRVSGWHLVEKVTIDLRQERQQWITGQLYYLAKGESIVK